MFEHTWTYMNFETDLALHKRNIRKTKINMWEILVLNTDRRKDVENIWEIRTASWYLGFILQKQQHARRRDKKIEGEIGEQWKGWVVGGRGVSNPVSDKNTTRGTRGCRQIDEKIYSCRKPSDDVKKTSSTRKYPPISRVDPRQEDMKKRKLTAKKNKTRIQPPASCLPSIM